MMLTDHTLIEYKIGRIFEQELKLTVPSPDADLFAINGLDSLSFIELLMQLEVAYGIRIRLHELDLADFRSIERIADFIGRRLGITQAESQYWYDEPASPQPEPQHLYIETKCPA
jgi:acyl carrier protein